jgi:hypothetical protein
LDLKIRKSNNNVCFLNKKGQLPVKNYEGDKIEKFLEKQGYDITDVYDDNLDCVASVESECLFDAGFKGIETILIPTGLGTEFYKRLFPKGKIFPI